MSDIICVTNRDICKTDFLTQIKSIAKAKPKAVILREKDLSDDEYNVLARQVMAVTDEHDVPCILHSFVDVAISLHADMIHLPMNKLMKMTAEQKKHFKLIGASCHSVEDAVTAQNHGCGYITAGHVFETDCKKGLAPRGPVFLEKVCQSVSIPVYAIGGINADNLPLVMNAGAKGACIMSGLMVCDDPVDYLESFDKENKHEI